MAEREMKTRFNDRCICGTPVPAQATVIYDAAQPSGARIRRCAACEPRLAAPAPAQTAIRVRVEHVKPSTGASDAWGVIRVTLDGGQSTENLPVTPTAPFSAVGNVGKVEVNDLLELYGSFDNHPRWGLQFKVGRAVRVVGGTMQSLRAFLARLPNLGNTRSEAIIQAFDNDREEVLRVIEHEPERLTVVKGITIERAKEIQAAFAESANLREVNMWLAGLELGESLAASILDEWGKEARQYLEEDPYRLMELRGVGFRTADEIALSKFRIHHHDPRRAAAAVLFLLEQEEGEGHTWTPLAELVGHAPIQGL